MIKFLIYLFLFYVLFRLLFGKYMGGTVKTKVFRFDTHHHHHYNKADQKKPEGNVTINPKINKTQKPTDKNIGEYVDYEEVK